MATRYWTTEAETPAVYHNNSDCSEGEKIKAENKSSSDTAPMRLGLCEVC
jgi:hypothetical protein